MVLEDIQAASLKTWLRNILSATDDDALKDLNWKKQVGLYLVKSKYAILRWTDDPSPVKSLPRLGQEIQRIAADTDVRHLPDYTTPSPQTLIDAVSGFQSVKDKLVFGDVAKFIANGVEVEMNLSVKWTPESIEQLAVKNTVVQPPATLFLAVKKPDYLGDSKWELRHGKRTVHAKIADGAWLKRFQAREVDVRPGDALECIVIVEHLYGHDNELISERWTVTEVTAVLQNRFSQDELFDEGA